MTEPQAEPTSGPQAAPSSKPATLDFWSGGWAIALAVALCGGVVAWTFLRPHGGAPVTNVRFDLSVCLVTSKELVVATLPDALPPIDDPAPAEGGARHGQPSLVTAEVAKKVKLPEHGRFILDPDRVVGVSINGEARAYPLRVLHWHEVVNDVVGGVPIVVTYGSLTDSVRVFDRRAGGATLRFGASGLLWNSNLLLYDRDAPAPSLWSQLQARAVTGPAATAGARLAPLRAQLVPWSAWVEAHPDTKVLCPDLDRAKLYKRDPYHSYAGSDILRFPVAPLPPDAAAPAGEPPLARKAPCLVIGRPGERRVVPLSLLARRTDASRSWSTTIAGAPVTLRYHAGDSPTATVEAPPEVEVVQSSWFGWFATHPDDARFVD